VSTGDISGELSLQPSLRIRGTNVGRSWSRMSQPSTEHAAPAAAAARWADLRGDIGTWRRYPGSASEGVEGADRCSVEKGARSLLRASV
jgi:hypothetical protein